MPIKITYYIIGVQTFEKSVHCMYFIICTYIQFLYSFARSVCGLPPPDLDRSEKWRGIKNFCLNRLWYKSCMVAKSYVKPCWDVEHVCMWFVHIFISVNTTPNIFFNQLLFWSPYLDLYIIHNDPAGSLWETPDSNPGPLPQEFGAVPMSHHISSQLSHHIS